MYYLFSYIVLTRNVNLKNVLVKDCIIIIKKIGFQTIFLKLNSSKTEIILVGSKNTITKLNIYSVIDNCSVPLSNQVKSLGVILDRSSY